MSAAPAPYNLQLTAASPLFQYTPSRDGDVLSAWNASYTQSSVWPNGGAARDPPTNAIAFRRTQSGSARISLTFDGSALYLCFATGGAGYALTLDNALVKTTLPNASANPICAPYAAAGVDTLLVADGLKDGTSHTALLQVSASAGSEFRFFGGTVTLGIPTNGKVVDDGTTLDDRNPAIGYAPSTGALAWDHTGTGRTLYNTTLTFNCNYGATVLATYAFTGAGGVVLLGNVWQDSHAFSVTLDDATTNLDATSSWQDGQTVLFARGGLDPAVQHTVSLRDFSADDTTCNQGKYCCTGLDAITLLKPGTADLPPATTSSASVGASGTTLADHASGSKSNVGGIVGGVVGALAGLALLGLLVWFVLRRRRRGDDGYARPPRAGNGVLEDDAVLAARPFTTTAPSQWAAESHPGTGSFTGVGGSSVSGAPPQQEAHWSPYAQPTGIVPVVAPVVASGDRKNRAGFGTPSDPTSRPSLSTAGSQYGAGGGYARSASNGSESAAAPRLAEEDLERVLAFVAQRMDGTRSQANLAAAAEPQAQHDNLPEYRA